MPNVLFVRISSGLDPEEFDRRLLERRPRFHEVPGLVQKIYGRDPASGDVCGIYFFESEDALAAFRESELAQTIPAAYEAVDVRREVYEVLYPLWPERGPLVEYPAAAASQSRAPTSHRAPELTVKTNSRTALPAGAGGCRLPR